MKIKTLQMPEFTNDNILQFIEREEPWLASSIVAGGYADRNNVRKHLGVRHHVDLIQRNKFFHILKSQLETFSEEVKIKVEKEGSEYFKNLAKACVEKGEKLILDSKELADSYFEDKTKWKEILKKYYNRAFDFCAYYIVVMLEKNATDIAREFANKYSKEKDENFLFELFTTSIRETDAESEMDDFLRITIEYLQGRKVDFKKHLDKYQWMAVRYFQGKPWSVEDIKNRMKNYTEEQAREELENRLMQRQTVEWELDQMKKRMSSKDAEMVDGVREIVFLRTYRANAYNKSSFYMTPVLKDAGKKLGIEWKYLLHLNIPEIISVRKDLRQLGMERSKDYLIFHEEKVMVHGDELKEIVTKYPNLNRTVEDSNEVKGSIAYKGKVKGKVRIVKTNEDVKKVNAGDIMVAVMTTPNLIQAMEKAAAFVTDEGGILCHAAIVAREMKKPCVIGTKIATKVFKDGDLVEVNADNGIVRRLK